MLYTEQLFHGRTQQAPNAQRWYVSISSIAMSLLSKIRDELAIREAVAELRELDDRMLRDIGLCRCDIASIRRRESLPDWTAGAGRDR
jgi:uncharacterized protein YjiS (DUF1127 family)